MWRYTSRHFIGKISVCCGGIAAVFAAVKEVDFSNAEDKDISTLSLAIQQSRRQLSLFREETGIPGLSIAVELDGRLIWGDGVGYADVENHTLCKSNTVMRIASISKPITMALIGRLWQEGLLDINKPIHYYVPEFPPKNGNVSPSLKQLASHFGGIRHYHPVEEQRKIDSAPPSLHGISSDDGICKEFYSKTRYHSVQESLNIFKNDEFVYPPGQRYLYTTYGYSLLGAAAEAAGNRPLPILYRQLFRHLGLGHTHLDDPLLVISNRSRQYVRTKDGRLENSPYVDNSIKWAGGGMLSSAKDIARFGSLMLKCYQCCDSGVSECADAYLSPKVIKEMWTPVEHSHCWRRSGKYALGWCVIEPSQKNKPTTAHPLLDDDRPIFTHSGGAVGGTTILLILPAKHTSGNSATSTFHNKKLNFRTAKAAEKETASNQSVPRGVSVAILANLQSVRGLGDLALDIALRFDHARKN